MAIDRLQVTCLIIFLLLHTLYAYEDEGCRSTQYLELNQAGTIQCFFQVESFSIHWYNSTEIVKSLPILNFQGSVTNGIGFTSGEYDIHSNGSLIIKNVTIHHERSFAVVKLNSLGEILLQVNVEIITTVHPNHDFPIITTCQDVRRVCFQQVNETLQLSCIVENVRPKAFLTWSLRSNAGDENMSNASIVENGPGRYTSKTTANATLSDKSFLKLYVCKAFVLSSLLRFNESYIVTENGLLDAPSQELATKYFKRDSVMELFCNEGPSAFIIWIVQHDGENMVLAIYLNDNAQEIFSDNYQLGESGSLMVLQVGIQHEGKYICLSGDGLTADKVVHRVAVYVPPSPPNPIISGCEDTSHCRLNVSSEGMLTCYINGIRPEVELLLTTLYANPSTTISFFDQKSNVKTNGDTFDVVVTSNFVVNLAEDTTLAVQCKVKGPNTDLFDLSARVDLLVITNNVTEGQETSSEIRTLLIILLVSFFLVVTVLIILAVFRRFKSETAEEQTRVEEFPIGPSIRPDNRLNLEEKRRQLVRELKITYQNLTGAIQPIPYLKEKYCVNSVFMKFEIEARNKENKNIIWTPVDSYHTIVNDAGDGSMRCIVQGDAGYGKSTLTLQLAYEWCNKAISPVANFDILVLLRLRQLGRTPSIFEAIRHFLLPKDSMLTATEIKDIFQNHVSVLIILDGYDEYPIQENEKETDIMHIIKRDMFQQIPVILTTRSSCLPKDFPLSAKQFRLNGFNESVRKRYIKEVVVGNDTKAAETINQRLAENPVLCDLLQVPLFFVMFAHLTYESEECQKFNSVTSFFTYMVACFHSHMRNKARTITDLDKMEQFEADHKELDRISLSGLSSNKKQIVWDKDIIAGSLGQGFYEHYVKIGILVEDDTLHISKRSKQFRYKTEVRFYHKIFCEWYAAHRLTGCEEKDDLQQTLKQLDPYELHYVYRFASGLQPETANKILEYLMTISVGHEFITLCTLEQMGKVNDIKDTIEYLSSDVVSLRNNNNNRLQLRSIIQILEIASSNSIPVPCVSIENCFQFVDCITWKICLGAGIFFSNLSVMEELKVFEIGREFTVEEVEDIFKFALNCLSLRILRFDSCLLPMTIEVKLKDYRKDQLEVLWNPVGNWYKWNFNSLHWEDRFNGLSLTPQQYHSEVVKFRKEMTQSYTNR